MKLAINENELLFEMANIRGKYIKVPHRLNFSFYFSPKDCIEGKSINHGLRVKPVFNSEKMSIGDAGDLKLCDDWKFIPGKNDTHISPKDKKEMIDFFKTYKILFAAVWEKELPPDTLYDYFRGFIDFTDLITEFYFYNDYKTELNNITTLQELKTTTTEEAEAM